MFGFFSKRAFVKPFIVLGLGLGSIAVHAQETDATDKYFEISKNLEIFSNIFKELNRYYVDPLEPGKMVKTGVDAMLNELDPYTNLITEADAEDYELQTTGRYSGIGATTKTKDGEVEIMELYEDGPLVKAGVKAGDLVVSINGEKTKGKDPNDIGLLMRGAPGTTLEMVIRNPISGKEEKKTITREEIRISSVPYAGWVGPQKNVAYVYLSQFTMNCSRDVRSALDSLKAQQPDMKGVVLDLRYNPGGLLEEAVKVCNLFIESGRLVVSTKGKNKDWDKSFKTEGSPWDLNVPLVVLINQGSASASEIVAGTIQDLDRGVVLGTRSFGKGLVQNIRPLGYNSRLKVTTAKYYTPSGRCIQAIDYAHRNMDGSVSSIPDSLKKEFKTVKGRKVYDGGGIAPDVEVAPTKLSMLGTTLLLKSYIFDYATQYYYKHPSIAPADVFEISDPDFKDFESWLADKDYSYESESQLLLKKLKEVSEKEAYYTDAKKEFDALAARLAHDKKQDLLKHKDEVKFLLANEIVGRYYYQKGKAINRMKREDPELTKTIGLLSDKSAYSTILDKK